MRPAPRPETKARFRKLRLEYRFQDLRHGLLDHAVHYRWDTQLSYPSPAAQDDTAPGWYIPAFAAITDARTHESRVAKALELPEGSIVVFDKGYICYSWFQLLGEKGVFFVTRLKQNAVYTLLERRPVNRKNGVASGHIIKAASKGKTLRLRRIGYRDPESGKRYEFLTNHFRLAPKTIADIYKKRWQIEIFFREIKQNPRIKTFGGNTENAVLIQLYTALTIHLLLAYQKFLSRIGLSIQQLCQIIQLNVLGSVSLEGLLNPRRRKIEKTYDFSMVTLIA